MAEKRSVYLSSHALAMPRRRDSLSGRINQALERYGLILRQRGPPVRAQFSAAEWSAMLESCEAHPGRDLMGALQRFNLDRLAPGDAIILAELLEAEAF